MNVEILTEKNNIFHISIALYFFKDLYRNKKKISGIQYKFNIFLKKKLSTVGMKNISYYELTFYNIDLLNNCFESSTVYYDQDKNYIQLYRRNDAVMLPTVI